MKDLSLNELRILNESYIKVLEAVARPNDYKNLSPEQAEELAKLSPSYKSNQIWGNTSNWICSAANRMIKFRKLPFETIYNSAKELSKDIAEFEKFSNIHKTDIQAFRTFEDLKKFMDAERAKGTFIQGLSASAKNDGRARQCLSLMKSGVPTDDFKIVFDNDNWIIGYPTNIEYNKKFSSIGKWCHTGSFGNAESYWGEYAQYPIFYILNKGSGAVLCASYQDGAGEVRDQLDNYPIGFNGSNWNEFFTDIGLKNPMVDKINTICINYDVPEDAHTDVWERVDEYMVIENLFADVTGATLEGDDYARNTGNFYLAANLEAVNPEAPEPDEDNKHLHTRYSKDVDESKYYTFEEFKALCKETWMTNHSEINDFLVKTVVNMPLFKEIWNNEVNMTYYSWSGNKSMSDTMTMADRFSIDDLIKIVLDEDTDFGFDMDRKSQDIRNMVGAVVDDFIKEFNAKKNKIFTDKHGSVDIYNSNIVLSIDADEGQYLANQIRDGNSDIAFEGTPDLLSANLNGRASFAMERVKDEDLRVRINNCIAGIKYICQNRKDIEGQQTFELKNQDGSKYYYSGLADYS